MESVCSVTGRLKGGGRGMKTRKVVSDALDIRDGLQKCAIPKAGIKLKKSLESLSLITLSACTL